jgi:hypothetical protein
MAAEDGAPKVGLHPLVQALNPDPAKPPQRAVKLFGLPGASPTAGETRLWLDSELTSYVDIPDDAILYSKELPDDAGTVVWAAVDAKLTYGSVTSHATQADFLSGAITSAHLAGAAAGPGGAAGPVPTPPVTLPSACGVCPSLPGACVSLPFCPSEAMPPSHCLPCPTQPGRCPSLPFCPSEAMLPTHCVPCPTHPGRCPSLPFCPSEAMPPSHCFPCQTHPPICPPLTQIWVCQPSQLIPCQPSVHVLCPTPTAVFHCPTVQICPSRLCPSVSVPCQTAQACPSAFCPPQSLGCGGPGGFGPGA